MPLPDQERINAEVQSLAEGARGTLPPAGARPASTSTPIYMGRDHEVIPERYVVRYTTTLCKNCGVRTVESEFFALSYLKSRVNGTRVQHMVKCDSPRYNLPIECRAMGEYSTPYCVSCAHSASLAHLPPPPAETSVVTLADPTSRFGRKPNPPSTPKPKAEKPAKGASLDDLI